MLHLPLKSRPNTLQLLLSGQKNSLTLARSPAVVVSYLVAALAALLSGLAYTEFVVDQPVAGGAFNMVSSTFGELAGWCVPCAARCCMHCGSRICVGYEGAHRT